MLVKCPRCGFSQPQDKYCAQCGVDMETFKPPRKSALIRYLTDPLLYLGIALILIGLSIGTLYKKDNVDLAQRVRFLKGTLQIASTKNSEGTATTPADRQVSDNEEPEVDAPAVAVGAMAGGQPPPPPTTATKAAAPTSGPVAYIYYAEVPRAALDRLYQESQATGQFNSFGDYTAGILPDMQKRITAPGLKIRILEKTEKVIVKNQQWFSGIHDPEFDEDLGLSTFIELTDSDNNVFRGNLEIVRSLREFDAEKARGLAAVDQNAGVQKNSFPAIFELGPGYGFFIAGVLPRKTVIAHEEELASKAPPFTILKSPAFQNKQSEFVIFIEFEKKP
ncbi:hypothetical protein [Bdellovibrio sp. HCB337]|uniref:hypothetical protein n=1 Tax=Bdellovibrio sp. HCB337 TaxID=3394358 RepID=UPI0039A48698